METLFVLIGIFFGQQELDIRIIKSYGNPTSCNQHAQQLTEKAKADKQPYEFYCRGASFTRA